VARDDASAAASVLSQEGLPSRSRPGVLDALGESSIVPSRTAEHAKLVAGTAGELERSLRGIDGILSARVHLAMPLADPLGLEPDETRQASASVLLRHRGATPPIAAAEVQRLIAGAVEGLSHERVSVVVASVPAPPRPPERELARFGPLTVSRTSMLPLRLMVGGVLAVFALLFGVLVALWSKSKKSEAALVEARPSEAASDVTG
jgi:type III secretion protein J